MSHPRPLVRALVVAGILFVGLQACGRRGALEPPPDATATAPAEAGAGVVATPFGNGGKRPRRSLPPPNDPFILDPLL